MRIAEGAPVIDVALGGMRPGEPVDGAASAELLASGVAHDLPGCVVLDAISILTLNIEICRLATYTCGTVEYAQS